MTIPWTQVQPPQRLVILVSHKCLTLGYTGRMKNKYTFILFLSLLLSVPSWAQSNVEEEEGLGYDALLQKLSRAEQNSYSSYTRDSLDDVKIHLGVGMANSVFTVAHKDGERTFAAQRGVEVALGIDLFSPSWLAEGTFRNFGDTAYENSEIALKEFDLKMIYHTLFTRGWGVRVGGGIAARYLDVRYDGPAGKYEERYQTPASVFGAGLETYLNSKFSLGADASIRNSLIDETPDKTAFDLTLRVNGHF